jgi:hypothetical protein
MVTFYVEKSKNDNVEGGFQLGGVQIDYEGCKIDVTNGVVVGTEFWDEDEGKRLEKYLSERFRVPIDEVDIEYIDKVGMME